MTAHVIPRVFFWWHRSVTIWWPWRSEPRIYVPRGRSAAALAVTEAHEEVHVRQWKRLGRWGFLREYLTKRGRMELEAEAFAASIRYLEQHGLTTGGGRLPLDHYAHAMSKQYHGLSESDSRHAILRYLA